MNIYTSRYIVTDSDVITKPKQKLELTKLVTKNDACMWLHHSTTYRIDVEINFEHWRKRDDRKVLCPEN